MFMQNNLSLFLSKNLNIAFFLLPLIVPPNVCWVWWDPDEELIT